jgi:hypothetical protein
MTSRLFGLRCAVVAVAALAACKSDPTADLVGGADRLTLEFDSLNVTIADSSKVIARVLDRAGDPVTATVSVTSCNTGVATVSLGDQSPLVQSAFFVKGITFGGTCAIATSGQLADTVQIATYPAKIVVTSGPDTLLSGTTAAYTYDYRDAVNNSVAGVPDPTFSSNDKTRVAILTTPLGTVQAKSPGAATITVTGYGPLASGISTTKAVLVIPGVFTGSVNAATAIPSDIVKITKAAGGPGFDADSRVFVAGARTFTMGTAADTAGMTSDTILFVMPATGKTGIVALLVDQVSPDQIALADSSKLSSTTASLDGPNEPANNDPATAPALTANGDYYIFPHGVCDGGAATSPGDDCDDFFAVTNPSATDTLAAKVQLDWFTGSDVDILWCRNAGCTSVTTGGGATTANPEKSSVKIPPGATWYLWINLYDPAGAPSVVARIRFTGFP